MERIFLFIYDWVKNYWRSALVLLLLMVGLSSWLFSKLIFKEDVTKLLPNDKKLEQVNLIFQNSRFMDKMVMTIHARDTSQTDKDELIKAADQLVAKMDSQLGSEYIQEVKYILPENIYNQLFDEFYENIPFYLDSADYGKIAKKLDTSNLKKTVESNYKALLSPAGFALKQNILKDPLGLTNIAFEKLSKLEFGEQYQIYNQRIFSKDGNYLMVFFQTAHRANNTGDNGILIDRLEKLIAGFENEFPEITAAYFGGAAVAVSNARQIKQDAILTASFASLILIFFISFFYRRKRVFLLIFLPVSLGGLTALSALYLIKGEVSAIALGVGSVLLGISIDYSLHIFTHLKKVDNRRQLLKDLSFPIMISSITTASAFFCLLLVRSEALHDLGLFAGISVLSAAIFSLILLPQLAPKLKDIDKGKISTAGIIEKISALRPHKNKWILGLIGVMSILFVFSSKKIGFETDLNEMNYVRPELQKTENLLNHINNYKLKSVFVLSSGKNLEQALQRNEKVQTHIQSLLDSGIVKKFTSPSGFMLSDSLQSERLEKWYNFWEQNNRSDSVLAQMERYGRAFQMKPKALQGLRNQINGSYSVKGRAAYAQMEKLFLEGFVSTDAQQSTIINVLKVADEDKEAVYQNLDRLSNISILDKQYLTGRFLEMLKEDFDILVKFSLLVVAVILLLSYGRIELTIFTLIPVGLAWLWTTGIMGLAGIRFNIFNIIISTFVLGLGIDYSIFLMRGLLQKYNSGKKLLTSYKSSILLSAFTTITGIGVLIFAKHPALRSIALMSIIGISSVVFISFSVTPLIFHFFLQRRKEKGLPPYTLIRWISTLYTYTYFTVGCFFISLVILILYILPLPKKLKKNIVHKLIQLGTKTLVYGTVIVRTRHYGLENVDWKKPKIIIANHQSFLDILVVLMQHPKIIMLTNEWVYNSPFFGFLVRFADFYPVASGYESSVEHLQDIVDEGYSIAVYPEGTRSPDGKLKRFHKGAFLLAEKLNLPIQPMLIHGSGDVTRKHDFMTDFGQMSLKFLPAIELSNEKFGTDYRSRTKKIGTYFKKEFQKFSGEIETAHYFRHKLKSAYLFKGPIVEWYSKVKMQLQNYYHIYDEICPKKGKILDLGCGYGYLSYTLMLCSENRTILGVDYDKEKIETAQNTWLKTERIRFEKGDLSNYEPESAKCIILNDVLHYLPFDEQKALFERCVKALEREGKIILRDGMRDFETEHEQTKKTEYLSTRLFKFNKRKYEQLHFLSTNDLKEWADQNRLQMKIVEGPENTSNMLFEFTHKHE